MKLAHYVLLDLGRRPAHSLIVAAVLTMAIIAMVVTVAYARALTHRLAVIEEQDLRRVGLVAPPTVVGRVTGGETDAALAVMVNAVSDQQGVTAVGYSTREPFRTHRGAPEEIGAVYQIEFVSEGFLDLQTYSVGSGRWLQSRDWRADGSQQRPVPVVVSARLGHLSVGDEFSLWRGMLGQDEVMFRVVGTFAPQENVFLDGHLRRGFQDIVAVPRFDMVAPRPLAGEQPETIFIRTEGEEYLDHRWFDWRHEAVLRGESLGLRLQIEGGILPLAGLIDHYVEEMAPRDRFASVLAVLVLALTVFGFGCLSAVSTWDRRREWGVHLAAGAGGRDVLALAYWEVVWLAVMPALLAGGLLWGHTIALPDQESLEEYEVLLGEELILPDSLQYLLLDGPTFFVALSLIIFIAVVTTITPLVYLRNRQTVELVRQAI